MDFFVALLLDQIYYFAKITMKFFNREIKLRKT